MNEGLESLRVCDSMMEGVTCWDENLVETLFSSADVIAILSTPLSTR